MPRKNRGIAPHAVWRKCGAATIAAGLTDHRTVTRPVEARPRIGLAPRRDVGMADTVYAGIVRCEHARKPGEPLVLRVLEWHVVRAFELDAEGKIVAAAAPAPVRFAGVPRALFARHELDQLTIAPDQEVRRHLAPRNPAVIRMRAWIEAIGEQLDDSRPAEFSRRQADVVDHQQLDHAAFGTLVAVGRRNTTDSSDPAGFVHGHRRSLRD